MSDIGIGSHLHHDNDFRLFAEEFYGLAKQAREAQSTAEQLRKQHRPYSQRIAFSPLNQDVRQPTRVRFVRTDPPPTIETHPQGVQASEFVRVLDYKHTPIMDVDHGNGKVTVFRSMTSEGSSVTEQGLLMAWKNPLDVYVLRSFEFFEETYQYRNDLERLEHPQFLDRIDRYNLLGLKELEPYSRDFKHAAAQLIAAYVEIACAYRVLVVKTTNLNARRAAVPLGSGLLKHFTTEYIRVWHADFKRLVTFVIGLLNQTGAKTEDRDVTSNTPLVGVLLFASDCREMRGWSEFKQRFANIPHVY